MRKEWLSVKLEMRQYRDTDIYLISSMTNIVDKLEDHIARTLVIASSQYTRYIEKYRIGSICRSDIQAWKNYLARALDVIEIWKKIQKNWLCLQPMFASSELVLQLPKESTDFEAINEMWTNVMANTKQNPSVMEALFQGRQYEAYEKANKQLEVILRGINDYLEKKRLQFPRFFFFSNEDLVFFLSREKEPASLEPYLHKCFEGVAGLDIIKDGTTIAGITSVNQEKIEFESPIPLFQEIEGKKVNRNVEDWLREIEIGLTTSLHASFSQGFTQDPRKPHPRVAQQIGQLLNQIEWTARTESAITSKALKDLFGDYNSRVQSLVSALRAEAPGEISAQKLSELGNLIVLNSRNTEVLERLSILDVKEVDEFEWQSELRYYPRKESKEAPVVCRIFTGERSYGFDYLADTSRLVIAPLTVRCYRTLLTALSQFTGGAAEGAPGIGKTETTKDLGKAVGKCCLVFSGSAVLQVDSFARLFKGVASSGMWVCIDEFNRIQLEVLSVVSQYVQSIFSALKLSAGIVDLQESTTLLNTQCGVFVTLNPGGATWDLPENLKVMFRSITMVQPDKLKIAETCLASYGFREARLLAQAMVSTFEVAQSQMSAKDHYDFSLRSLKNALRTAFVMLHRKVEPIPVKPAEQSPAEGIISMQKTEETKTEVKTEAVPEAKIEAKVRPEKNERMIIKKALQDSYLPRLDAHDAIIFGHILSDNFPKALPSSDTNAEEEAPAETSVDLLRCIDFACRIHNLRSSPEFSEKLQQLYDILTVRPSTILLGGHCTGKSTLISALCTATSIMGAMESGGEKSTVEKIVEALESKEGGERLMTEELDTHFTNNLQKTIADGCRAAKKEFVELHWISPKSFNMSSLYGEFDTKKSVWKEGLLPHCIRKAIAAAGSEKHWIVFDGEVDKSWSEGLYSALDDTRKLCLPNSECLLFPRSLCLLFETPSLSNASPAIVGRCGIVMTSEAHDLGWNQVYDSWLSTLPPQFQTLGYTELFSSLKKELLDPLMAHAWEGNSNLKSASWAISSFAKVFECALFGPNTREELELQHRQEQNKQARREAYLRLEGAEKKEESPHAKQRAASLTVKRVLEVCALYLQALTWSVAAMVPDPNVAGLLRWIQAKFSKLKASTEPALEYMKDAETVYPAEGTALNTVFFDTKAGMWTPFSAEMWKIDISKDPLDLYSSELLVPNEETCKYLWIAKTLMVHNENVLMTGTQGTGKSRIMRRVIEKDLAGDRWMKRMLRFSGKTSAGQVQELVENQFEKRVKDLYAPKAFGQRLLLFIDDLHLPHVYRPADQQPVELLRALLCHKGIYDAKTHEFKRTISVQLAGIVAPNTMDSRFARHFNMIRVDPLSEGTLGRVFSLITEWAFVKYEGELNRYANDIAALTLNIYSQVTKTFLPVPARFHYRFSLQKVFDVIKGLVSIPLSVYEELNDENLKLRLVYKTWMHECTRTFADVLGDYKDRKQFEEMLKSVAEGSRHVPDWSQVSASPASLLFSNIAEPSAYKELALSAATEKIKEALAEYAKSAKLELGLVLCEPVVRQVVQVARLLGVSKRHGLLIGVGGNGRTKLTKIACFLLDWGFTTVGTHKQFGRAEWRENLKQLYKSLITKRTVFLCSDQILGASTSDDDCFVDDLNAMLSTGEIPELYGKKERDDLVSDRKHKSYEDYIALAKRNLHVMLCMNPATDSLRKYFCLYPSLISSTSTIYFLDWPEEALRQVAKKCISESPIANNADLAIKAEDILVTWHTSAQKLSEEYYKATRVKSYITQVGYMELLECYNAILSKKQALIESQIQKFSNGVHCLEEAAVLVQKLSIEIEAMKPGLDQKNKEAEKTMAELTTENETAKKLKEVVEEKEVKASLEKKLAEQLQQECQEQLSKALPMLEEAKTGLSQIKEKDLIETRTYSSPTTTIKTIMEMILIMLGRKVIIEEHGQGKKRTKAPNYWKSVQEMLKNTKKVRDDLQKFDKKRLPIPEDVIKQVRDRLDLLQAEKVPVHQSSGAMLGIYDWVQAILVYDKAEKAVMPKREALKEATAKVEATDAEWLKSQEELKALEAKCAELEERFKKQNSEKETLKQTITECQAKFIRAQELKERLKGEKKSWGDKIKSLKEEDSNLFGDVILAAGFQTYLGPFTAGYRKNLVSQVWVPLLEQKNVKCTKDFSFARTLASSVDIMQWHAKELPSDPTSEDNATMMVESKKCPLLIDPQGLGAGFLIKKNDGKIVVLKYGEDYLKKLKMSISSGTAVIIEKVDSKINSILFPLLDKQVYLERGQKYVKLDDTPCVYRDEFRLYFTTPDSQPHLVPQVYIRTLVVNFSLSQEAISDHLMHIFANIFDRDNEQNKIKQILKSAENRTTKDKKENEILDHIRRLGPKILDDQSLVNTLADYKSTTERVEFELRMAKSLEEKIDDSRVQYKAITGYCSHLYFAAHDMANIDHMYQFSMPWFIGTINWITLEELYMRTLEENKPKEDRNSSKLKIKVEEIVAAFKTALYKQVYQALQERDKLLFSFIMSLRILQAEGRFDPALYDKFAGKINKIPQGTKPNPLPGTLTEDQWCDLSDLKTIEGTELGECLTAAKEGWKAFIAGDSIAAAADFPAPINVQSPLFQLVVFKILRPDRITQRIEAFVQTVLGEELAKNKTPATFRDLVVQSGPKKPIMLILTPGNDPLSQLNNFAKEFNSTRLETVSLGQGQGGLARKRVQEFRKAGGWLLLQNCHLFPSWMSELEDIVEETNLIPLTDRAAISPEYRLWMTSASSPCIPISVLQRSVKYTDEPRKGIKQTIARIYSNIKGDKDEVATYSQHKKANDWKKLFMGLAFFHSILVERSRHGAIGWNGICQFTDGDFVQAGKFLYQKLADSVKLPFDLLTRATVDCFYADKMLDVRDKAWLVQLLGKFYNDNVIYSEFKFCDTDPAYYVPLLPKLDDYIAFIEKLPEHETPELLGLGENVEFIRRHKEFKSLEASLLMLEHKQAEEARELFTSEDVARKVMEKIGELIAKLPATFSLKEADARFPTLYDDSLNTILRQELVRYNLLLQLIKSDLTKTEIMLKGNAEPDEGLENICGHILNGTVPDTWRMVHPVFRRQGSLAVWFDAVCERVRTFVEWVANGRPKVFWLSAFWNLPGFLTAVRLNYARKAVIPIEKVGFDCEFFDYNAELPEDKTSAGVYVRGLYLENAAWDADKELLVEAATKQRYCKMPIVPCLYHLTIVVPYPQSGRQGWTKRQSRDFFQLSDIQRKRKKRGPRSI